MGPPPCIQYDDAGRREVPPAGSTVHCQAAATARPLQCRRCKALCTLAVMHLLPRFCATRFALRLACRTAPCIAGWSGAAPTHCQRDPHRLQSGGRRRHHANGWPINLTLRYNF